MEWIDLRIPREHRAKLVVTTAPGAPIVDLSGLLGPTGYRARFVQQNRSPNDEEIETNFDIRWKEAAIVDPSLDFLAVVTSIVARSLSSWSRRAITERKAFAAHAPAHTPACRPAWAQTALPALRRCVPATT